MLETKNVCTLSAIEIAELKKRIEADKALLKAVTPQKETPLYILERRGFVKGINDSILNFGAVQRAANKALNNVGAEGVKKMLSDKQVNLFVDSRLSMAIKSKKLLLKVANKGKDIQSLSPNAYFSLISKFCTLNEKEFLRRKEAK
jgi:hypothetical protein